MAPASTPSRSHLSERSSGSASTLSFTSSFSASKSQPNKLSSFSAPLTKSNRRQTHHPDEFQITNVAAFEAATREITRIIEAEGYISSTQCAQIVKTKNTIVALVQDHFPHAYSTTDATEKVMATLQDKGCTRENTIFAHSVCSDANNSDRDESMTNVFSRQMMGAENDGDVFQLGGLAGIPFARKAGFNGFAHQAPENGHCFVLLAPHVGMDSDGTLGSCVQNSEKKHDEGQEMQPETSGSSTACCASAIDAFNYCCTHGQYPKLPTVPGNPEFTYLLHQLGPRHKMILAHEEQNAVQAELARHCHEIARGMLSSISHTDFGGPKSSLIVLTGIQINMPAPFEDFFQPLSFYVVDKIGRKKDLFVQTFGHWSPLREKMKEKSTLMFFCT